ncbi:MAG: UDP-glucose 4-epimerase GalE [Clostridia bacterium]|nr:UDP-glucose 4-epimerase GalE [Clostridia bacterium]
MENTKYVLVTGGAGFIGSHTCVELIESGYMPVIIDNLSNSKIESLARLKKITGVDIPFYQEDVRNREALDMILDKYPCVAAIHFAGYKAVGESVAKPIEYYQNNLGCTLTLCEALTAHNVKRVVFSSSATVYREGDEVPLKEEYELGCTNPYGWTKYMSEQMFRDLCVADKEWSAVLLRYFNPIGAHKSGIIGEEPNGIPNNLMPYVAKVANGELKELRVFGNDYDTVDGTGVRDYIHVVDLAKAHVLAIGYACENTGAVAINVGTGRGYSVLEVVAAFEKATGQAVPYAIVDRRPGDLAEVVASPEKASALLGFKAQYGIDDMCEDAWRFEHNLNK